MERANDLQKAMKSRFTEGKKIKKSEQDSLFVREQLNVGYFIIIINLQISVCMMKKNRPGSYSRNKTPCIEMATTQDKSYGSFAKVAADCHQLRAKKRNALFNLKGAMISDGEQLSKPWTVGGYLKMLKCEAANFRIGVGYVSESSESSDEVMVLYGYM